MIVLRAGDVESCLSFYPCAPHCAVSLPLAAAVASTPFLLGGA